MRVTVRTTAPHGSLMVIELPDGKAVFVRDNGAWEIDDAYSDLWVRRRGWLVLE